MIGVLLIVILIILFVKKFDGLLSIIVDEYNKEEKKVEEKKLELIVEFKLELVEKKEEVKIIFLFKENLEYW